MAWSRLIGGNSIHFWLLAVLAFTASLSAKAQVLPGAPATTVFTPSKNVSNNQSNSWFQQMAIDQQGNINLVWLDNSPGYWAAFFSRSIDGGLTFSNPQNLSNDPGGAPNIAVDPAGTIYIVWTARTGEGFFIRSSDGSNFSPPVKIADNMGTTPSIALGSGGSIYLGWVDGSPYHNVFFNRSNDGGRTFSSPVLLSTILPFGSTPLIAVDSSGNIDVAWQDNFSGVTDVWFARSSDAGNTFFPPLEIGLVDSLLGGMVVGSSRDINVVFNTVPYGNVYLERSTDGGSTFIRTNVSNNHNRPYYISPESARIGVDSADNINVVWDDSTGNIYLSRSTDQGVTFSSNIIPNGTVTNVAPGIVLDSSGNMNLVWTGISWTNYDVFFSRSTDAGTTFSTPQKLSNNTVTSSPLPQITLDLLGNPYIAWMDNSPGNPDIFFSRSLLQVPPALPKLPPLLVH